MLSKDLHELPQLHTCQVSLMRAIHTSSSFGYRRPTTSYQILSQQGLTLSYVVMKYLLPVVGKPIRYHRVYVNPDIFHQSPFMKLWQNIQDASLQIHV